MSPNVRHRLRQILIVPFGIGFILLSLFLPKKRKDLVWGPTPIISNKYWSLSLQAMGWSSTTAMFEYYSINRREDFDVYADDLVPRWVPNSNLRTFLSPLVLFLYFIRNAKVVHLPFSGGPLGGTAFWRLEAFLYRWAGIKIVVMPYGADAYMYSQVMDPSLRHGLLTNYPKAGKNEQQIAKRVAYWTEQADCVICGIMIDGMGRWDLVSPCLFSIDTRAWSAKVEYGMSDGTDRPVKVVHTPNHRGFKGTEFLIDAVESLRCEGLQVELILLEKVSNEQVRKAMSEADILAEQFIFTGYALSGIEGMACGLPVMANLDSEVSTRLFRRYAFLNECPVLSTTPETLKENLRLLVTNPVLRVELGRAGRKYVEKYHSYATSQYMFKSVYDKLLNGSDVNLLNLFHPLLSDFCCKLPRVSHPLFENRFPSKAERRPVSTSI